MQLRDRLTGNRITLDLDAPLGRGGEAQVYPVVGMPEMVAKIYAPGKATTARAHKLAVMLANPPEAPQSSDAHVPLAWPHSLLTRLEDANAVVGFLMPRAHAVAQVIDYYNPQRRLELCPLFDYRYLLRTARNLASATRTVHACGYVIGDLKHSNVLVSQTALVTLVDTDSFQVRDPQSGLLYVCQVETPDYTPPERQNDPGSPTPLTPEHDLFALGVLIFQLVMEGTHPFAGVYSGEGDPPSFEERIAAGHFPYGANPGPYRPGRRAAPAFEILPPTLQTLFLQCFEAGNADPTARPDAQTWQIALDEVCRTLAPCADNPHHFYSDHLHYCPWCERRDTQLRGLDPFPATVTVSSMPEPVRRPDPVATRAMLSPRPFPPTPLPKVAAKTTTNEFNPLFAWIGIACVLLFLGVSFDTGAFQGSSFPNASSEGTDIADTMPAVRMPSPDNGAPVPQMPAYTALYSHKVATYDSRTQLVTLTHQNEPHVVAQFGFPRDKFLSMEFSGEGQSLLFTEKDHSKVQWNIAQQQFR